MENIIEKAILILKVLVVGFAFYMVASYILPL